MKFLFMAGLLIAGLALVVAREAGDNAEQIRTIGKYMTPSTKLMKRWHKANRKMKTSFIEKLIPHYAEKLDEVWFDLEPKVLPSCNSVAKNYKEYAGDAVDFFQTAEKAKCNFTGDKKSQKLQDMLEDYSLGVEEYSKRLSQYCPRNTGVKGNSAKITAAVDAMAKAFLKGC